MLGRMLSKTHYSVSKTGSQTEEQSYDSDDGSLRVSKTAVRKLVSGCRHSPESFANLDSGGVERWLDANSLGDFKDAFREAQIDGGDLLQGLSHDDLNHCGAPRSLKRRLLLRQSLDSIVGFGKVLSPHRPQSGGLEYRPQSGGFGGRDRHVSAEQVGRIRRRSIDLGTGAPGAPSCEADADADSPLKIEVKGSRFGALRDLRRSVHKDSPVATPTLSVASSSASLTPFKEDEAEDVRNDSSIREGPLTQSPEDGIIRRESRTENDEGLDASEHGTGTSVSTDDVVPETREGKRSSTAKKKGKLDPIEQFIREVNAAGGEVPSRPLLFLRRQGEAFALSQGLPLSGLHHVAGTEGGNERQQDRVLDPESVIMLAWQGFIIVIVAFFAFSVPVRLVFTGSTINGSTDFVDANDPAGLYVWIDLFFDVVFIVDVILTLNTAILIDGSMELHSDDREVIADRVGIRHALFNLKTWTGFYFLMDVLACFPESLVNIASSGATVSGSPIKLVRMLKVFRVMRLFKFRRAIAALDLWLAHSSSILRLLKLFIVLVVVWHIVACVFFLSVNNEIGNVCTYCSDFVMDTTAATKSTDSAAVALSSCVFDPDSLGSYPSVNNTMSIASWRFQSEDLFRCGLLADTSLFTRYSQSYFWAVMVTFGVGRDVVPQSDGEVWLVILLMILGTVLEAIIIGGVSSIFVNLDANETERRKKMESITSWMEYRGVPVHLQRSIRSYYDFLWTSSQTTNQSEMVSDLPPSLNVRLQLALYLHLIKKVPIFSQCEPDCVAFVITLLNPRICIPGEFIITEGELGHEMFFVHRGKVMVLLERGVAPVHNNDPDEAVSVRKEDAGGTR